MPKRIPPRLHVLLARDASTALVLRHGPHQRWQFFWWDRARDTFSHGGSHKGVVYARRCDLSPDAGHLLLCAERFSKWQEEDEWGAWTAITCVPSLHPMTLVSTFDNYHGGGVFLGRMACWTDIGDRWRVLRDDAPIHWKAAEPGPRVRGGAGSYVYGHRLIRDGWTLIEDRIEPGVIRRANFDKRIADVALLRKSSVYNGRCEDGRPLNYDTHAVLDLNGTLLEVHPDWEWADFDGTRLIWASKGRLLAARVSAMGIEAGALLHDFNHLPQPMAGA